MSLYEFALDPDIGHIHITGITDAYEIPYPYSLDDMVVDNGSIYLYLNNSWTESPDFMNQKLFIWFIPGDDMSHAEGDIGPSDAISNLHPPNESNSNVTICYEASKSLDSKSDTEEEVIITSTKDVEIDIYNVDKMALPKPGEFTVRIYTQSGSYVTAKSLTLYSTSDSTKARITMNLETGVPYQARIYFTPTSSSTLILTEFWGMHNFQLSSSLFSSGDFEFIRDTPYIQNFKINDLYPDTNNIVVAKGTPVTFTYTIRWIGSFWLDPSYTVNDVIYIRFDRESSDISNSFSIKKGTIFTKSFSYTPTYTGSYRFVPYLKSSCNGALTVVDQGQWTNAFTVTETTPPVPSPNDGVSGWSRDNTPTFSWSSVSGAAKYEYKVDSGSVYSTTSTSVTLPAQSDGIHTFYVRSVGSSGIASSYGSHEFKIDATAPPTPSPNDGVSGASSDNTPTFSWPAVSDMSGIARYEYKVDSGSVYSTTSTSVTLLAQSDGMHTFYVRAVDNAGNVGSYGSHSFEIRTTAPPVPSPNDGVSGWSSDNTPTFSWSSVSGASRYEYEVDSGSALSTTSTSVTLPAQSDGIHTFYVRSVGSSGIASAFGSHGFSIDTSIPPAPSPDDGVSGASSDNTPTFSWPAVSDTSGIVRYEYKVDSGSVYSTTSTSVTLPVQSDGIHTFYVRAVDNAGNSGNYGSHSFEIETSTPNPPPVAQFSANPTSGQVPLTVLFTDQSTNTPTSWLWNFGDGSISTEQHPVHTYTAAGNYAVTLTASNMQGSHTLVRNDHITASPDSGQAVLWNVSINVTSGSFGQQVILGSAASATRSFDSGLDVPMPPDAPGVKKSVYLVCDDPTFDRLSADYKAPVNDANPEESWTLSIRSDEPVQIAWNTTLLCDTKLSLTWRDGTSTIAMKAASSTTLPAGSYSVIISASTAQQMDLPLKAGWNLVSIPFSNAEYTIPSSAIQAIYGYNSATKSYETISRIDSFAPGKAYWIASTSDCIINVTGMLVSPVTAELNTGWNLIGSTAVPTGFSSIAITPVESWAVTFVYGYSPQTKGYVQTTGLQLGGGYWGAVIRDCTITFP